MSVTLVHPTQGVEAFGKLSYRCVRWPSSDLRAKFYGDSPRETPPSGALNARGYQNRAIADLSKAISHKRYKIDV